MGPQTVNLPRCRRISDTFAPAQDLEDAQWHLKSLRDHHSKLTKGYRALKKMVATKEFDELANAEATSLIEQTMEWYRERGKAVSESLTQSLKPAKKPKAAAKAVAKPKVSP